MALTKVTGSVIKDSVSLSGNVSVGGTLTYQDVTNVDALGIGTFRTGIKVLAGQVDVGSNIKLGNAGVITATSFVGSGANLTGVLSNIVEDTSPQLGGDLDTNSYEIFLDAGHSLKLATNQGQIYHSGSQMYIGTNDLRITNYAVNETMAKFVANGAVELYYNDSKKLETTSSGITLSDQLQVTGTVFATGGLKVNADNQKLRIGAGDDLEIHHSGTVSFIDDLTSGSDGVSVRGKNIRLQSNANVGAKSALNCIANGAVELFHNDTKQCETSANGLAFPAGKGIDFSATSDYTGAGSGTPSELLDEYEEGTFTPRFQTSNGNWGGSMNSQAGSYTRIGNFVHIRFRIHWGSVSGSGTFRITALPFTVANTASNEGGGATIGWRSGFNYPRLTSFFRLNTQLLQFGYVDASGSFGSFDLSVGAIASTGYAYCSGSYEVA